MDWESYGKVWRLTNASVLIEDKQRDSEHANAYVIMNV